MNITAEMSIDQKAQYLRTLPAVRQRCQQVFERAQSGELKYFQYHPEKEAEATDFCIDIMKRDFGNDFAKIPPHGRWRHFDQGIERIGPLISKWSTSISSSEICKRLIDLFVVSVLLDAGAGNWVYHEDQTGQVFSRSEGLAICSLRMFEVGFFSSDPGQPYRVDASVLSGITVESMAQQMQVSSKNTIVGLEGRTSLLINLGKALQASPKMFGQTGRPGDMLEFLEHQSLLQGTERNVPLAALWHVLIEGLNPVWPASRVSLAGVPLGDVWQCEVLQSSTCGPGDDLVPFHKLTQWMTYSLIEVFSRIMDWKFVGIEDMTGLPEYRNGGLFLDLGVLSLKSGVLPQSITGMPQASTTHPAIVEWRALTVILLDRIADSIREKLGLGPKLTLAQVLESATWKGGREIAKRRRPDTGGPPIELESDGTVF